jgi:hypothetical protein
MNTFLGAIGDIPPYVETGAFVPDSLLLLLDLAPENLLDIALCDEDFFDSIAQDVLALATQLDRYNAGEFSGGPKHCDSEVECVYSTLYSDSTCASETQSFNGKDDTCFQPDNALPPSYSIGCKDASSETDTVISVAQRTGCKGPKTRMTFTEDTCAQVPMYSVFQMSRCSGCPDIELQSMMEASESSTTSNTVVWIILAVLLALVLIVGVIMYCYRGNEYTPLENRMQQNTPSVGQRWNEMQSKRFN